MTTVVAVMTVVSLAVTTKEKEDGGGGGERDIGKMNLDFLTTSLSLNLRRGERYLIIV